VVTPPRASTSPSGPASGVLGGAGRLPERTAPTTSDLLVLGGRPLPVVGTARIWTCGITPYDVTHLGHAATFVWADTLASVLRALGVATETCRNVTDVDDVLTAAARRAGRYYDELALGQEFLFERDMTALAVARPDHVPHARAHVGAVVQLAAALLRTGAAYERDGWVLLRGADLPARAGVDEAEARRLSEEFGDLDADGGAGDPREDAWDVPVWRPSGEDDPAWPSPWGWGRPGWHAECAAMAMSVLGAGVDVLVGGADLAWPHHAYQAAMVEAATGTAPFARARLHVGTVHHEGSKMAKSTGNLVLVHDLLEAGHSGAAVRLALLDRPWGEAWTWDAGVLDDAAARLEGLYAAAAGASGAPGEGRAAVLAALADDLDVPAALAVAEDRGGEAARTVLDVLRLHGTR